LDVRTPPQVRPVMVQFEIERQLSHLGIDYELDLYKSLLGHEGKGVEPVIKSLEEIHQYLFGTKLNFEAPDRASIWTDTNVYNELGIPAVKIGPRGKRVGPRTEELDIDQMVKAAQIYALAALDLCSRERQ
jgi:acetylornithine deacetylase/succinyl-diaminopimelate desuccinylase-like protein